MFWKLDEHRWKLQATIIKKNAAELEKHLATICNNFYLNYKILIPKK